MSILINNPGLFTTIQDEGRFGYQDQGFSTAGVLDLFSFKLGQKLIGNNGPALEFTIIGPSITFKKANTFVITGGEFDSKLNGQPIHMKCVYHAQAGDELKLGKAIEGARGYILFGSQIDIPMIANSYSTHTRSGIGGFKGRALKSGDNLPTTSLTPHDKYIGLSTNESVVDHTREVIHIVEGPQYESFSSESIDKITKSGYEISEQSDRMGYRLKGDLIPPSSSADITSEPVALGSIQVPNDGNPIILLNDKQTVGGYTKIATVTQADLPILAQKKPGDVIYFKWISIEEAISNLSVAEESFNKIIEDVERKPVYDINQLRSTSKRVNALLKGEAK
ncbi:biotin-dependent carboxyltransferase family protein [Staphylococcus sp. SQ8-PEA]|uniref:Biotin-dependent carboxyltransferase family protein n=1 Tax=Staphylococcus marylandisciuri TaxID=2981529 RepID=A0ABT2QR13_9STAP|nr:biotin-dependent carboxyltransferase family protein [Staphylococcus marylandisciuri]MCU5746422.1 biotin-dependent carboxyltransferase family protein [Staphylococcus marylandisciuri]